MNLKRILLLLSLSASLMTLGCAKNLKNDGASSEADFTKPIDTKNSKTISIFDDSEKLNDSSEGKGTLVYRGFKVASMLEVKVDGSNLITYNHTPFIFKNITLVFANNVKLEYQIINDFSKVTTTLEVGREKSFNGGIVSMESTDAITKKEIAVLNSIKPVGWRIYGFCDDISIDDSSHGPEGWFGKVSQTQNLAKLATISVIGSAYYLMTDDFKNHFLASSFHDNNGAPINSQDAYDALRTFNGGPSGTHIYVFRTNHPINLPMTVLGGLGARPDFLEFSDFVLWQVSKALSPYSNTITYKKYIQMGIFIHELNHTRGYSHGSNLTEDTTNKGTPASTGLDDLIDKWIEAYGKTNELPIDYITEARLVTLRFTL